MNDTDPRQGYIAGNITFGPNALDGYVDEDPIFSYSIYWVDSCGVPHGNPLARIPKRPRANLSDVCCSSEVYKAEVRAKIPYDSERLVIVPVTSAGPLPVGELTDVIADYAVNKTIVAVAITSAATPCMTPYSSVVSVTFVTAAAILSARFARTA